MIKHIYIIYNPMSTGNGEQNAKDFAAKLAQADSSLNVQLIATEHARHAFDIAKSKAAPGAMIISSSGDGGFHEVVNGVLTSSHPETIVGLLPSGNANDHYRNMHQPAAIRRIISGEFDTVDVLQLKFDDHIEYAHSYIGIGLTADIGKALNQTSLNHLNELWLVLRGILNRRHTSLYVDGKIRHYDSIVYSVVEGMSKVFQTGASEADEPGSFIAIKTPRQTLLGLLRQLFRHIVSQPEPDVIMSESFTTTRAATVQCDGEVLTIPPRTKVAISADRILREII